MAGAVGDLYALLVEYLDVCDEAVASSPGGAIPRSFVSPGLPAFDCCPQLTVHAGGPILADTVPLDPPLAIGQRAHLEASVHLINMTATVIRCVPTLTDDGDVIQAPPAAGLEVAAEQIAGDVWAIWNVLRRRVREGSAFADTGSRRREVFFDPAILVPVLGGCGGWQVPIRVQLGGYGG